MISDLLPALGEIAEQEAAAGRFSGTVLVARGTELIFTGAYGMADRERGIPNTVMTRFNNGSQNTMFTGVSVAQLIQSGLVDPAAPLGTYLCDYPIRDLAATVTVHQLLTHTGGAGDVFGPAYVEHRADLRGVADYVVLFGGRAPRFEPGTRYEYSDFGFVLLGAVIEAVTGQAYHDYVAEHVFAPAGMTRTGPEAWDGAVGYLTEDGVDHRNTHLMPYRGTPAGCDYTTVDDLWRFALALLGHKLLDAHHTALVTTGRGTFGWDARRVCYGFFEEILAGVRMFGHVGGMPGTNADLVVWPKTGHVVTVLSNMDPPSAVEVSRFIVARLPLV